MSTIKAGSRVGFHYTLKVEGHLVDSSDAGDPFYYVQGSDGIVTGLETQMTGLKVGDKRDIVVQPEEGYGIQDPDAIHKVPRDAFGDADKALQPIFELANRLDDDPETQSLLRTIAQDERSTLEWFGEACQLLNG